MRTSVQSIGTNVVRLRTWYSLILLMIGMTAIAPPAAASADEGGLRRTPTVVRMKVSGAAIQDKVERLVEHTVATPTPDRSSGRPDELTALADVSMADFPATSRDASPRSRPVPLATSVLPEPDGWAAVAATLALAAFFFIRRVV